MSTMEDNLRSECKSLLEKLKSSQFVMKAKISGQDKLGERSAPQNPSGDPILAHHLGEGRSKFGQELPCEVNVDADTDLKPSYARHKLSSLSGSHDLIHGVKDCCRNKENLLKGSDVFNSKMDNLTGTKVSATVAGRLPGLKPAERLVPQVEGNLKETNGDEDCVITSSSWLPATPGTQRRRQMIDRHTAVPTKLDSSDLQDLNKERLLNFSYSHINVDDNILGLNTEERMDPVSDPVSKSLSTRQDVLARSRLTQLDLDEKETFHQQLTDDGNNRRLNTLIKDASIKPKSILNSTDYYSLNNSRKNTSRVRFNQSQSLEVPDHRMLGYDWIAALLDNDSALNNQSESFFDDIKDFRKAYKDECSNRFYMESPYTLVEHEPAPVVEALTEPKVRPYVVNDRLFTEPFRPDLIDYEDDDDITAANKGSREPTKENPRFVRVSIPRSTLQTPHRVKPHRRGSFDAADSCALMDHCLLGWENSRPAMLPSAHTVDLNTEAGTRVDSHTTTLAEAERQASLQTHIPSPRPIPRQQTLPNWSKQYMNTTLNLSIPPSSSNGGTRPSDVKRATDKLLSSTYSTMYEMERLRQEREIERRRNEAEERRK